MEAPRTDERTRQSQSPAMSGWRIQHRILNTVSFIKVAPKALGNAYVPRRYLEEFLNPCRKSRHGKFLHHVFVSYLAPSNTPAISRFLRLQKRVIVVTVTKPQRHQKAQSEGFPHRRNPFICCLHIEKDPSLQRIVVRV